MTKEEAWRLQRRPCRRVVSRQVLLVDRIEDRRVGQIDPHRTVKLSIDSETGSWAMRRRGATSFLRIRTGA